MGFTARGNFYSGDVQVKESQGGRESQVLGRQCWAYGPDEGRDLIGWIAGHSQVRS